jgi:hypothetical protein
VRYEGVRAKQANEACKRDGLLGCGVGCDAQCVKCGVRDMWYKTRGTRYEARDTRYAIRGTWYTAGSAWRAQARMENVHILVASWVRTPLPEGVLVGAARYPLHQLYTIRNELCCKYITLILYSSQAGLSPPR